MDIDISWPVEIEQYERKIYDLKQLIEISKGLNSTLDYNTLIESILLTCMGQMQLLKAGIFLKKGLGSDCYSLHRNYKGFEVDHSLEYDIHSEGRLISFLEDSPHCYTLDELSRYNLNDRGEEVLSQLDPSLLVPLMSRGQVNGIIILGDRINKNRFTENEKEYLMNIASLAGIAINNARLYEMATTDMMTHLKIHHFFHAALDEEFERAMHYNRPLALIMADLDHFKQVNDAFGHTAGDTVLMKVAQIIKDNIRLMDIAARYGGEEFAIILPKTDMTDALIVAERIRENIEREFFHHEDLEIKVSISIGLSVLDHDRDTGKGDLIERADRALYMSKNGGRNQVSFL